MQLQPAVVVTADAYLALYPDDAIATRYVVINGCRRLAAAHKYGRSDLAIVVNDDIARDRITLISAASPKTSTGKTSTSSKKPAPWKLS